MKKRSISLLLALALLLSLCPFALADGAEAVPVQVTYEGEDDEAHTEEMTVSGREVELVYGAEALDDRDALVLLIMGDGFQEGEQDAFYAAAEKTADHIMSTAPFDEFADSVKIYALGVISNAHGVQGEDAASAEEAAADVRDTAFGSSFWTWDTQRLIDLSPDGAAKGYALRDAFFTGDRGGAVDYCMYLVNSETYGGSGGEYCIASLNEQSVDIMVHEMGHTIANLSDEYYMPGYEGEYANLSTESDPAEVPWARFVGKNGIGVYDWGGYGGTGYYIPATECKMQYLSYTYTDDAGTEWLYEFDFCDVCKEALRDAISAGSNVPKLFFQTYADEFVVGEVPEMDRYFLFRQNGTVLSGSELSGLTLTYYSGEGAAKTELPELPQEAGTYTVVGEYRGCTAEGVFVVTEVSISLAPASKMEDGKPARLNLSVQGNLTAEDRIEVSYEGYQYYTYYDYDMMTYTLQSGSPLDGTDVYDVAFLSHKTGEYDYTTAAGGPALPGTYTVTVSVYRGDALLAEKTANYKIAFKTTRLVDNNDPMVQKGYYGAQDYGNNKTVLIFGEGFDEKSQGEFLRKAKELADGIVAVEPFREAQLYFNFVAVSCISEENGVNGNTFFGLEYDENGVLTEYSAYNGVSMATTLANYDLNPYTSACIVLVNDTDVQNGVYDQYWDRTSLYYYFSAIFVTPTEEGSAYAADMLLRYLTGCREEGNEAEKREILLGDVLYADYAPVLVSTAYNETFPAGEPVDLAPYFQVYYGREDNGACLDITGQTGLELTYYRMEDGRLAKLKEAPSEAGEYYALAETVPEDADNPEKDYWTWVVPEGKGEDDGFWIGRSRGWTAFTIGDPESGEADAYYAEAVRWAADLGAVEEETFDPDGFCTRADALTLLWRALGQPESAAEETTFTDVSEDSEAYAAVLWARDRGVTVGTGETTFSPDAPCSCAHMVTFLWRLDGEAEGDGANRFRDVAADAYYAGSVRWAVETGVTAGTSLTTFTPDAPCTNAQIVTFLYRCLAG